MYIILKSLIIRFLPFGLRSGVQSAAPAASTSVKQLGITGLQDKFKTSICRYFIISEIYIYICIYIYVD